MTRKLGLKHLMNTVLVSITQCGIAFGKEINIPLGKDGPRPTVNVTIGQSGEFPVVLDTGTTEGLILNQSIADELGLKLAKTKEISNMAISNLKRQSYTRSPLQTAHE